MNKPTILIAAILLLNSVGFAQSTTAPSAETATQNLAKSTRHGEWVDIEAGAGAPKIKSWVVYPERKDKAPVVIVIHEIFGMSDWVRSVADQLAAEGFIAIAPDFLSGMGPNGGGTESLGADVGTKIRTITPELQAKTIDAVREYAIKLPSATQKVGVVGFCWGGSASFSYATRQPKLNAAAVYYGSAPKEDELLGKIPCPVIGFYGGNDARINSTLEATEKSMTTLKKPYTKNIYEGAGHGFLRQQSAQNGANLKAAEQAWPATIKFFKQNLE